LNAVKSLGYKPLRRRNRAPAQSAGLKGKTIALLLLGLDRSLASLPSVADAIHGIESAASEAGANLLLADVPLADRVPPALEQERVSGVILKGALQGRWIDSILPELDRRLRNLPTVWFLGRPHNAWGDVVQSNDMRVGQIAAEYLLSQGHKHLAFINPKPDQMTFLQRQASFVFHAELAGATVQKFIGPVNGWRLPLETVKEVEPVQGLVDALVRCRPRPTALFVPGDSVAAMVYRALYNHGLVVGRDFSIISCNNEAALLAGLSPQLTTIDIHADAIGQRAVDQLAWRISHRDQPAMDLALEPTLLSSESVFAMPVQ
jgi:LacI family transcriptional regulator